MEHTTSEPLIYFHPHTQYENLGDVVINRNLLRMLRSYGAVIVNDRNTPRSFLDGLGVTRAECFGGGMAFRNFFLSALWSALRKNSGGVYLFTAPGHTFSPPKENALKLISLCLILFILRCAGVRIARIGVSLGKLSGLRRYVEALLSRLMFYYGVRDSISLKRAQRLGLVDTKQVADLALVFPLRDQASSESTNLSKQYFAGEPYSVFSFRETAKWEFDLLPMLLRILGDLDMPIILVSQVERDRFFMQKLAESLVSQLPKLQLKLLDGTLNLSQAGELYASASMVFSNRLHVLLFAALENSLPVAVIDREIHAKIIGILEDASLSGLIIDTAAKQTEQLEKFARLKHDRLALLQQAETMINEGRALLNRECERIFCDD